MTYTPKMIKRTLKKCINEISARPETFVKNPGKDFTRERKLPFKQVLKAVLSMTGKSLRGELMEHFNLKSSMPTVSAFVQQRNKVDHRAFEALFHTFTMAVDEQALFKGYRLLAVDGSDLHTPTNKDEADSYHKGTNGQKPYNLFHLNALYDLQRKIYTDSIVQGCKQWNEHRAFVTMVDRDEASVPTIYIADRGYDSYNNMAHVIEKAIPMLPYYLSFRVVRFKHTQDTYEVLFTNLPEDEFSVSELKELYAMHWGIETSFRDLKYSLLCLISTLKKRRIFSKKSFQDSLCTTLLN